MKIEITSDADMVREARAYLAACASAEDIDAHTIARLVHKRFGLVSIDALSEDQFNAILYDAIGKRTVATGTAEFYNVTLTYELVGEAAEVLYYGVYLILPSGARQLVARTTTATMAYSMTSRVAWTLVGDEPATAAETPGAPSLVGCTVIAWRCGTCPGKVVRETRTRVLVDLVANRRGDVVTRWYRKADRTDGPVNQIGSWSLVK